MNQKSKSSNWLAILVPGIVLLLTRVAIAVDNDDVEETISGTVVAVAWNEDNEATAIAIRVETPAESSEDEDEYEENYIEYGVTDTKKGNELWDHIGEMVEAVGTVTTDEDGAMTINVTSFKVIETDSETE